MKYRVLIQPWAVYVKEEDFFIQQGGDKEAWGKRWEPIEAESLEDARLLGYKMRRDRDGTSHSCIHS